MACRSCRAFGNLLRTAVRDPVWAITGILFGPFHTIGAVLRIVFITAVVGVVIDLLSRNVLAKLGVPKHGWIMSIELAAVLLLVTLIALRLLSAPLVRNFGDGKADTHGSPALPITPN